jgi:GNAT superfamily N-acetyltransferase
MGLVWGVGDFQDGELRGLITWGEDEEDPRLWEVVILATALRWHRRGVARGLKEHLLERARSREILRVVSFVHGDNEAMIALNRALGAQIDPDPNDAEHVLYMCRIDPFEARPATSA